MYDETAYFLYLFGSAFFCNMSTKRPEALSELAAMWLVPSIEENLKLFRGLGGKAYLH
ncbi:hypothetical protein [Acetomicrobium sp.]|uniref:hypothetical protein n=1 Tax=Acetomicrobium sp. TaxID=1872099 RepID=UPI00287114C8|nr:hypothetical protein [Acetomicrobium sp.]MDR9769096.1 hypothetical protein [Acetomicrobium sp.]